MAAVHDIPTFVITVKTPPPMIAGWLERQRRTGEPLVILTGHSAQAVHAAYAALTRSGTLTADDPNGATRPFHPIVRETDQGDTTRSEHISFQLHVWLGPAEPLGPAVVALEMDEGLLFLYGRPLPIDEDTQYSTAVHSGARLVSVGPLHFHSSVGSEG